MVDSFDIFHKIEECNVEYFIIFDIIFSIKSVQHNIHVKLLSQIFFNLIVINFNFHEYEVKSPLFEVCNLTVNFVKDSTLTQLLTIQEFYQCNIFQLSHLVLSVTTLFIFTSYMIDSFILFHYKEESLLLILYFLNMSAEEQSIGMMQGAFFVSKSGLLEWVNSLLDLNITKIQQLGTGAVYCQIIDVMFPGKIALQRVNWKAKNEWQFIINFKILQQGFAKCKINKHIDIEKLAKSRYQDNLQFIQWLKRFFDLFNKSNVAQYNPKIARKSSQIDFSFVKFRQPQKRNSRDSTLIKRTRNSISPYNKVKSRINNRSSTTSKYKVQKQQSYYINKLKQIRDIINKKTQIQNDKIQKIQEIMEEIKQQLPCMSQIQEEDDLQLHRLQNTPTNKYIKVNVTKKMKTQK